MKEIELKGFQDRISPKDIIFFENFIGKNLPDGYKEFITQNGCGYVSSGYLEYAIYRDRKKNKKVGSALIDYFFAPIHHERYGVYEKLDVYKNRMPNGLIPIGEDPGGNIIVLSVRDHDYGVIYFWDHENETDEGEAPNGENLYFIASSFLEFLDDLLILGE
jgi:hypothetical protein